MERGEKGRRRLEEENIDSCPDARVLKKYLILNGRLMNLRENEMKKTLLNLVNIFVVVKARAIF